MIAVLLTVHSLVVLALIGVVLLQRSEGGALGMGGGGGGGGFMTGRGAANVLTRTTSVLAVLFFTTSLLLGVFHSRGESDDAILRDLTTGGVAPASNAPAPVPTTDDLLRSLGTGGESGATAPTDDELLGPQSVEPAPAEALVQSPAQEDPN